MPEDIAKFVMYCKLCHVKIVSYGSTALQVMELVARCEEQGDKDTLDALMTCSSCQQALLESSPTGRSN